MSRCYLNLTDLRSSMLALNPGFPFWIKTSGFCLTALEKIPKLRDKIQSGKPGLRLHTCMDCIHSSGIARKGPSRAGPKISIF